MDLVKCDLCKEAIVEDRSKDHNNWNKISYFISGYGYAQTYIHYSLCPECWKKLRLPEKTDETARKDISERLLEIIEEITYNSIEDNQ